MGRFKGQVILIKSDDKYFIIKFWLCVSGKIMKVEIIMLII